MKKYFRFLAIVALVVAVALIGVGCGTTGRTGNSIRTGGTISNPDGSFEQVWTQHTRDQFGREMIVSKSKTTKSVFNERTKKYEVVTTTSVDGSTGGRTMEADAFAGFIANIPNAAGDIIGATILKGANWGTTVNNSNAGASVANSANNSVKNKVSNKQQQGQIQNQAQQQKQKLNNTNVNLNNNNNKIDNKNTNTNTAQGGQGGNGGQGGQGGNGGNGGNGGSGGNGGGNSGGDKPGNGYGDKNHDHTGPPGQS